MRYEELKNQLVSAVLAAPGDTPGDLRRAALDNRGVPAPFAAYVDKVARHAYRVTDADIAALEKAGHSDDSLFEITVAAAVGAALHRWHRGMAALRGEEPD